MSIHAKILLTTLAITALSGCVEIEEGYAVRSDGSVLVESLFAVAAPLHSLPSEEARSAALERVRVRLNSPEISSRAVYREVSYSQKQLQTAAVGAQATSGGSAGDMELTVKVRLLYTHFLDMDPVGPVNLLVREGDPIFAGESPALPAPPRLRAIPSFPGTALLAAEFPSLVTAGAKPFDPLRAGRPLSGVKVAAPSAIRYSDSTTFSSPAKAEGAQQLAFYPDEFGKGFPTTRYFAIARLYRSPEFLFCLVCSLLGVLSGLRLVWSLRLLGRQSASTTPSPHKLAS